MTENTDADATERTGSDRSGLVPLREGEDCRPPCATVSRPPCDACELTHHDGRQDMALGDETYSVCERCFELLEDVLTRYNWWDRLTKAHYDRAGECFQSLDAVWCVKANAYAGGEIWIHTPFCDAAVVNDVCEHFGFRIRWFSVVCPDEHGFDCVHDHGPCIEINLVFDNWRTKPRPLEYDISDDVTYRDVEWLKDYHKLFTRED
ncbi:hypothetical protein [Halocatena pleomorpha]|uniref:Uncharacterized protein n=1 Tax=Halocatena pleomorpha TaxID=1785090 RepID=A0A3P3R5E1_9EURY|nr:hypothetical protein [Halocatena pleomorpha]RRJ28697.1 hypothetical protein EIK79_14910 [Halocatena pleomorpha]